LRDPVIELAEGRVPDIVLHVLDHTLTVADAARSNACVGALDDISGECRTQRS
jgi:hypothetical protein